MRLQDQSLRALRPIVPANAQRMHLRRRVSRHTHLLLLHHLEQRPVLALQIVELVDAADAAVRERERARLERHVVRHDVLAHRHREACAGARHAVDKDAVRRGCGRRAQQLRLAEARVADKQNVRVGARRDQAVFIDFPAARAAAEKGEDDAEFDHVVAEDGGAERVREVQELVRPARALEGDNEVQALDGEVAATRGVNAIAAALPATLRAGIASRASTQFPTTDVCPIDRVEEPL
jgi:hypothetical protein